MLRLLDGSLGAGMNWLQTFFKSVGMAEDQAIRSVALLAATIQLMGMNVNQALRHTYNGDDEIRLAKALEKYLRGEMK